MSDHISSRATFFFKFVFPSVIIGLPSLTSVLLFLDDNPAKWIVLLAAVTAFLIMSWVCLPLKKVEVDGDSLRISNFVTTVTVPIAEVTKVTEAALVSIHPVWIHFRVSTKFGKRIVFMPTTEWSPTELLKPHRVVRELRKALSRP